MITYYGTHGSRLRINRKLVQEEYKTWVLVAEAYRLYQDEKQGKQTASSTKSGRGEEIVLQLIECLIPNFSFDIVTDNYFTYFRPLTHLGVNSILAMGVLNKNRLCKCTITGEKQLQKKRNVVTLNSAHQDKRQCNYASGW